MRTTVHITLGYHVDLVKWSMYAGAWKNRIALILYLLEVLWLL